MQQFNIKTNQTIEENYALGLLPQRNDKDYFYQDSSGRSDLSKFLLSSENRRIIRKTQDFSFISTPINEFNYSVEIQKQCFHWAKNLGWDFPASSIKNIFTNHIFNHVYTWRNSDNKVVAYAICYFSGTISHIAYVFYDSAFAHDNLPIRLVLQVIIDSFEKGLKYCYLGRFSDNTGFYKRNMPGFQFFDNNQWVEYNKRNQ